MGSGGDLCEVCRHTHEGLVGACPACGCKGFWRAGQLRCDNPECDGGNCSDQRLREAEGRPGISINLTVAPEAMDLFAPEEG